MAHSDPALAQESPLRESELSDADALVREVGWNQVAADWRIFLDLGTVYAVRNGAGRVVATAATLPHGGRFAWISMVLVTAEYRRQGLARRLLNRCVTDLTRNGLVPVLDATPAGRSVYTALGFADTWGMHRLACHGWQSHDATAATHDAGVIRAITDSDWRALCHYDATAFGADRRGVLDRLRGRVPGVDLIVHRGDRVVGFLLGRDGRSATQLGPLVANDDTIALALLHRGLAATQGPIYIDLADTKTRLRGVLEEGGFLPQRPLTRMVHKRGESFDDPVRTFAVAGPELG
ncbi:MAG: GNAT family N-acetyltransferase [Rhizobiales bacterium]|nr:GNAT family N-acetyltransferase [Hyphomicrobiales bacterium]